MSQQIDKIVEQKINAIQKNENVYEIGRVIKVNDYVLEVEGLLGVGFFERVRIGDKAEGYVRDAQGNYVPGKEHYFQGENIWNGPITLLVNQNSASASDHLTMVMQGMENVKVMGFTEPNGSGQGLNGIYLESGDLSFSSALMMNRNGEIYIDSGVDRESGNQIDVVIPFDAEAVRVLFDEGGDYVLQKCLEYYE